MVLKVCGIDVGKEELAIAITSACKPKTVANSGASIQSLMKKLVANEVTLVVVEATGGYEQVLVASLWQTKIEVAVINPRQSRAFAKSIGLEAKTDPVDARLLAQMGECVQLRRTKAPSPETMQIRALLMRRAEIVRMLAMERCHLQAPLMPKGEQAEIREHLKFMQAAVKKINQQIQQIVLSVPDMRRAFILLTSTKGVGKLVAWQLIANLQELGRVNRRQIAALVGVAPYNCDSGTLSGARQIRGGRSEVRTALYMATVTAIRCNDHVKPYFIQLKKRGKLPMVAIVAAMRKFLLLLNAMMRQHLSAAPTQPHNEVVKAA